MNSRCPIHDSDKYDQFISDLTGGMVQTSGYHHDGSIKYEAVKLDNPQTTTIGKTMHKTIW